VQCAKHVTESFSLAKELVAESESVGAGAVASVVLPDGPLCSVRGCIRKRYVRGLCRVHYFRMRENGDPLKQRCGCGCRELVAIEPHHQGIIYVPGHGFSKALLSPSEKLRAGLKSQPVSARGSRLYGLVDDCQVWTGPLAPRGYGRLYVTILGARRKGRLVLTHRLAYELANGRVRPTALL
jgi:hypothetical protein